MANTVRVVAIRSFQDTRMGDTADVELTSLVQGLIDGAYLEVVPESKPVRVRKVVDDGGDPAESGSRPSDG